MNASPTYIGPYKVLRKIGEGGMGEVHECSTAGGSRVAVKTIKEVYRDNPEVRERFRSEIGTSKAVRGPYVADYFDSDEDELWLATRYYPWPSIRAQVAEHGPLSVEETAELAARVAEALHNIHIAGRVHRDLSPANILYLEGDVRVIDYGISKDLSIAHGAGVTGDRPAPYTWRYASPEHIAGRPVSEQSDYFSLGCVLAYAATGQELLDDLRLKRPDIVPGALRSLVVALTQDDPWRRPTYQMILDWTASLVPVREEKGGSRAVSENPSGIHRIAVAQTTDNRFDLFALDNQSGHVLHRLYSPVRGWSRWGAMHLPQRHADRLPRRLASATRSTGDSDLFVVLDNGVILHRPYRGNHGWSEWIDLASGFFDQPIAAASIEANGLDLYTTDDQGHLLHRTNNNQYWSEWSYIKLPAVNHPHSFGRLSADRGGWKVTHLAAAGTPAGDRSLVVSLGNLALAYTAQRQQGKWSGWVWVSASSPVCSTLAADEKGTRGMVADLPWGGRQIFFEHWHSWEFPGVDLEDVVMEQLPEPWSERIIVDLVSSISDDGIWHIFALLDDGSILHRTRGWTSTNWRVVETGATNEAPWLLATEKTHRIPPLPPTTPLTDTGQ